MTVKEVYELGVSYLPEVPSDNPDLQQFVVGWVNVMLVETFEVENSIRAWEGGELLTAPQVVKSINDDLVYHESLTVGAFPFGIAANAFVDDDNDYRSNKMGQFYTRGVNAATKYIPHKINDVY